LRGTFHDDPRHHDDKVTSAGLCPTLEEIATIMRHGDVGAVLIVDDDELVGGVKS
jgi:hypothetical protein